MWSEELRRFTFHRLAHGSRFNHTERASTEYRCCRGGGARFQTWSEIATLHRGPSLRSLGLGHRDHWSAIASNNSLCENLRRSETMQPVSSNAFCLNLCRYSLVTNHINGHPTWISNILTRVHQSKPADHCLHLDPRLCF